MTTHPAVTCCLTSAGRFDLLEKTLESFFRCNTYPISEWIISEDNDFDGDILTNIHNTFYKYAPKDMPLAVIMGKVGQIKSLDRMYKMINTNWFFGLEEDWLFTRPSFIEKSLEIMESRPEILQVWLREQNDTNNHPIIPTCELYDVAEHGKTRWSGFSLNPSLKRLSDYKLTGRGGYSAIGHEVNLSEYYNNLGFIAAITKIGYIKHIGQNRHIKDTTRI